MATTRSSVSSDIFNVYDEIVSNGISYCVLCLRSELERKLVQPRSFSVFLNSLSNAHQFQNLKVCYVCEAHALSAVKFITAVKCALTIDQLFHDLKTNKNKTLKRDLHLRLRGLSRVHSNKPTSSNVDLKTKAQNANPDIQLPNLEVIKSTHMAPLSSNASTPRKRKLKRLISNKDIVIKRQRLQIKKFQAQNRRLKKKINKIEDVLKSLQEKNLFRNEDVNTLQNTNKQLEYPALTTAAECERQFSAIRARAHLSVTEVLLVGSQEVHNVKPNAKVPCNVDPVTKAPNDIETVVLDDDEEDAKKKITDPPKPVTLIKTSQEPQISSPPFVPGMQVMVPLNDYNQFVLHPILSGIDGKLYIPTLQNSVTPNTTVGAVTPNHLEKVTNYINQYTKPVKETSKPNLNNMDSKAKYTVNICDIEDSILPDVLPSSERPKAKANHGIRTHSGVPEHNQEFESIVDKVLRDKAEEIQNRNKRSSCKETGVNSKKKCNETSMSGYTVNAVLDEGGGARPQHVAPNVMVPVKVEQGSIVINDSMEVVKNAILDADSKRIDWEDKIPMDVISFMDATDPNPQSNICKVPDSVDIGYISEIRSLGSVTKPPSSTTPSTTLSDGRTLRNVQSASGSVTVNIPCIDLC